MCFSSPNGKKVVCGDWKRDTTDTNEQSLAISQIINHPSYNINTQANDISILKVTGSFTCSQGKVYPACLPSVNVSILHTFNFPVFSSWRTCFRNTHMKDGQTPSHLDGAPQHLEAPSPTHCDMSKFLQFLMPLAMSQLRTMVKLMPPPWYVQVMTL